MSARERLTQLIDLASGDAANDRCALARELVDVLIDWPADYPTHMRPSFALLLEKIAPHLEAQARAEIGERMARTETAPLSLLSEFFFDCGREGRDRILARIADAVDADPSPGSVDELALFKAARTYPPDVFVHTFARHTGVPVATVSHAVRDASGEGLAILCKGANLSRLTFSTIAMLAGPKDGSREHKLEAYDSVSEQNAMHMVTFWREQRAEKHVRTIDAVAA